MSSKSSERRPGERVTDAEIEAAITTAGIDPDACEWYGHGDDILFRVTRDQDHGATRLISPWSDQGGVEHAVRRAAEGASR